MKKQLVFITVFAIIAIFVSRNSGAQGISMATQNTSVQRASLVQVKYKNTPLEQALQEVARLGGLELTYKVAILPRNARVNYEANDVAVEVALGHVLAGTGIRAVMVGAGKVTLVRDDVSNVQGVIIGKVTDAKTGRGIPGASISVSPDTRGVITREDGSYRLYDVTPGTHTVSIRLVGYAKQTRSITVGEGATITVDFKLEPSANVLDQVVVTGTIVASELKSVPNAITLITAKQIEERGITKIDQLFRGDIPGLFAMERGTDAPLEEVVMFSRGATALSTFSEGVARGTNPIKTYIDGVELADAQYLSQIDPKSIERIEILSGPQASTIYGSNAINGVMQIFTKRGSTDRLHLKLNLTSGIAQNNFNNHLAPSHVTDLEGSGTEGRFSYNVGSSWNYLGAWTPAEQTQRFNVNSGGKMAFKSFTADLSARNGITKNKKIGDAQQGQTDLYTNGWYAPIANPGLFAASTSTLNGRTVGLDLRYHPSVWMSHEVVLGVDGSAVETIWTNARYGGSTGGDTLLTLSNANTSRVSQRYTAAVRIPMSALAILNLTLGGDHSRNRRSTITANPVSITGTLANPTISRIKPGKNRGAFVQGQLSVKDVMFLTYGARMEWNPTIGNKARVLPGRYGVSYAREIGAISAKLRGSYGRSTRPPRDGLKLGVAEVLTTPIALFGPHDSRIPNSELGPEYQQGGEGGLELYLSNRGSLIITRYNQTVEGLISQIGGTGVPAFGLDSIRSLLPNPSGTGCSSTYFDDEGYCYRYQSQVLNVGSIRNQGWELQGSINTGPFTTRGSYSWTKSRVIGITPRYRGILTSIGFTPGRPFDYLPEHTWALGMTYAKSATTVSLNLNGIGTRYKNQDMLNLTSITSNGRIVARLPRMGTPANYRSLGAGYIIADINSTHTINSHVQALLQMNNLTNDYQNDFSDSYASIGRQTKLGIRIRY